MKAKITLLAIAIGISIMSPSLNALPLLSETAGLIQYGNVTLYRDHQDSNKVYFFPNSTKFSRDQNGIPLFNFTYWGLGGNNPAEQGAYFTMTSRPDSDKDQREGIEKFMADNPNMKVAVLPIKSSTIGLQTTRKDSPPLAKLFEEFNFAKAGGRAEDEIGINAVMTGIGAKAFKALLLNSPGGSYLKFDYCYVIQGLGPNMDAKIDVKMDRVYEAFAGEHSGGYGWFSWNIKAMVEKLNEHHDIHIEMNGGDAKEWEYLQAISEAITQRLFKPELSVGGNVVGEADSNRPFRFTGGYKKQSEYHSENWTWVRRDLVEREFCTDVTLKDLAPYLKQLVVNAGD
jgi:hypothetical protein